MKIDESLVKQWQVYIGALLIGMDVDVGVGQHASLLVKSSALTYTLICT